MLSWTSYRILVLPIGVIALVGCASLDYTLPETFDLSGSWNLVEEASDSFDLSDVWSDDDQRIIAGGDVDPTEFARFIEQDFPVVSSDSIRIEQDQESMGIQFQDAPYKDYSWGKQTRSGWRIEVGWVDDSLIIEKTRGNVKGTETYKWNPHSQALQIEVVVRSRGKSIKLDRVYTKGE